MAEPVQNGANEKRAVRELMNRMDEVGLAAMAEFARGIEAGVEIATHIKLERSTQ